MFLDPYVGLYKQMYKHPTYLLKFIVHQLSLTLVKGVDDHEGVHEGMMARLVVDHKEAPAAGPLRHLLHLLHLPLQCGIGRALWVGCMLWWSAVCFGWGWLVVGGMIGVVRVWLVLWWLFGWGGDLVLGCWGLELLCGMVRGLGLVVGLIPNCGRKETLSNNKEAKGKE